MKFGTSVEVDEWCTTVCRMAGTKVKVKVTQGKSTVSPHGTNFLTLNISETTWDGAIVSIERQQEVICALPHGDISNDLDGPRNDLYCVEWDVKL